MGLARSVESYSPSFQIPFPATLHWTRHLQWWFGDRCARSGCPTSVVSVVETEFRYDGSDLRQSFQ